MSSGTANYGRLRFDDLQSRREYSPNRAYAQSKLADLVLARHLARIARERGWSLRSVAAHPGFTRTNLQTAGPSLGTGAPHGLTYRLMSALARSCPPRRSARGPSRCCSPRPTRLRSTAATTGPVGVSGSPVRPPPRPS